VRAELADEVETVAPILQFVQPAARIAAG